MVCSYIQHNDDFLRKWKSGIQVRNDIAGEKFSVWKKENQYIANVWFTMIISVAIYAIEFICMRRTYGMPYLNAPLISLTFIGDKLESGTYMNKIVHNFMLNVTIGQFMLAQFIIKLIIVVIIMAVMMWGGRITRGKNKIFTLISRVIAVIYVCVAANSGLLML